MKLVSKRGRELKEEAGEPSAPPRLWTTGTNSVSANALYVSEINGKILWSDRPINVTFEQAVLNHQPLSLSEFLADPTFLKALLG